MRGHGRARGAEKLAPRESYCSETGLWTSRRDISTCGVHGDIALCIRPFERKRTGLEGCEAGDSGFFAASFSPFIVGRNGPAGQAGAARALLVRSDALSQLEAAGTTGGD